MSKNKNIWEKVEQLVESGEVPVVKISSATAVPTKGGAKGRRVVKQLGKPYDHFVMHTPGGKSPLSCRAPGCRNRMRAKQSAIVCSDACKAVLTEYCTVLLGILKGELPPEELPAGMRTHKLKRILR